MRRRGPAAGAASPSALLRLALVLVLAVLLAPVTVLAQDEGFEDEAPEDERSVEEQMEELESLLEGEEQILAGEGFAYDPANRRDPFKSLLAASEVAEFRGPRPEGVPGLLIDEILITGIIRTPQGYVAQAQSAEQEKAYLLREGDQLYDGDVVRITPNEMVFKQIVQDPTALKPFREVVKTLNPEGQGS